jgi:hypothetical protein
MYGCGYGIFFACERSRTINNLSAKCESSLRHQKNINIIIQLCIFYRFQYSYILIVSRLYKSISHAYPLLASDGVFEFGRLTSNGLAYRVIMNCSTCPI